MRKGNKRYKNVIAIDKLYSWLIFNDPTSDSDNNDRDESHNE